MEMLAKTSHRRRCTTGISLSVGVLLALFAAGCAAPMSVKAAAGGNWTDLKAAILRERTSGKLDKKRVADVAMAVAEREIRVAAGDDAVARIDEARACWRPLAGALEERAQRSDESGAAATLALLDGKRDRSGDASLVRKYGGSQSGPWRAVAARAAVGPKLGDARRKFYVDPDERVRLAALRSGLAVPDFGDSGALLEVARLDPNPLAQALAARTAGGIASPEIALALRDRYATADEGLRQSIIDGWSRPPLAKAGGEREIIIVAENERGAPAIEAGASLLQMGSNAEARAIGRSALVRAIGDGLSRDRVLAVARAPIGEPVVLAAVNKAAADADIPVRVAALTRLTEVAQARTQAWGELRKLAAGGTRDALFALARAGDPSALERVVKELSSPDSEARLSAMNVLLAAGRFASAADLLADAHPDVRMRAACAVLSARAP